MATESNQSKDPSAFLPEGTEFGGQVIVQECLSIGKKTILYKCYQTEFPDRTLVLAVVQNAVAKNNLDVARFRKGVAASYSVSHPNVLRTYDCLTEGDMIGYTMDFAPRGSLDDILDAEGMIQIPEVLRIATQVCAGLQAVHSAGIVHRDVRPKHILFNADNVALLSGFGVALIGDGPRLTSHGEVVGTVGYASPEYLQHGTVDHRSDIYAFGLVMYEMITGSFPFSDANPVAAITARMTTDPEAPISIRPECPLALSMIVQRAIARSPEQRYQTAQELLEDLKQVGNPGFVPSAQSKAPTPPAQRMPVSVEPVRQEPVVPVQQPEQVLIREDVRPSVIDSGHILPTEVHAFVPGMASGATPKSHGLYIGLGVLLLGIAVPLILSRGAEPVKTAVTVKVSAPTPIESKPEKHPAPQVVAPEPKPAEIVPAAVAPQAEAPKSSDEMEILTVETSAPTGAPIEDKPAPVEPQVSNAPPAVAAMPVAPAVELPNKTGTHTVVAGDTVNGLADKYGTSPEVIIQLNGITNRNLLLTGQVLRVPETGAKP